VWPTVAGATVVIGVAVVASGLSGSSGQKAALPYTNPAPSGVPSQELARQWKTLTDTLIQDFVPLEQKAVAAQRGSVSANAASLNDLETVRNSASSAAGLLNTYVLQLGTLPWTSSTQTPRQALIKSSLNYRTDLGQIQGINSSTTPAMVSQLQSIVSSDTSKWKTSLLAMMAALGITDPTISGLH